MTQPKSTDMDFSDYWWKFEGSEEIGGGGVLVGARITIQLRGGVKIPFCWSLCYPTSNVGG